LSGHISIPNIIVLLLGYFTLSFTSSIVYIVNDIHDIDVDKKHPTKKNRPLASGALSLQEAVFIAAVLSVIVCVMVIMMESTAFAYIVAGVLAINMIYTNIGKRIPFVEFALLGSLYILRTASGFLLLSLPVPIFLAVTMFFLTVFMYAVQRLVELTKYGTSARSVLEKYSKGMLKKFLIVILMAAVISYYLTVSFITGPILYTEALLVFVLVYINELITSETKLVTITDSIPRIILSNKILLIAFGLLIFFIILFNFVR
jgi:4-hydroxybenzoate polyprenyltransferase